MFLGTDQPQGTRKDADLERDSDHVSAVGTVAQVWIEPPLVESAQVDSYQFPY